MHFRGKKYEVPKMAQVEIEKFNRSKAMKERKNPREPTHRL